MSAPRRLYSDAEVVRLLREREEIAERDDLRAAYRTWSDVPLRANIPRCGDAGYEPQAAAPQETLGRALIRWGAMVVGTVAAMYAALSAFAAVAQWIAGTR